MTALIGRTPLRHLSRYAKAAGIENAPYAKLECFNLTGSVKDRVALSMIADAEARGLLTPGATIVEPTSGNTGIGLAAVGAGRGYHILLTMPDTMSAERRRLLAAYGAQLVLTDGALGMDGAIAKAEAIVNELPGAFMPGQFFNPANPRAHYETTGPEIWGAMKGRVDIFVAGVGTGGTVSGIGRFLKERNRAVQIVAVEPAASPVLSGGRAGRHNLQGIGAGFIPKVLDTALLDEVIPVWEEEAYETARQLARTEGLLAGISAGAALYAAACLAGRAENRGKTVVTLLPDSGERYLSEGVFGAPDGP